MNTLGFSLGEMMVGLAVGSIVTLAAGSFFIFGQNQYQVLQDENGAEQDLLRASFYLRMYLSQAVKTACAAGAIPNPVTLNSAGTPVGIGEGQVDCRNAPVVWTPGAMNALAVFIRENGGTGASVNIGGSTVSSSFQGTGIYFTPSTATTAGTLTFAQAQPGVAALNSLNSITVGHLVDIQLLTTPTQAPNARLESIAYVLKARYFLGNVAVKNYLPTVTPKLSNTISMTVNIGLHDNWLGVSMDGTNSTQRLNGAIYYFRFTVPMIAGI